MNNLKYLAVSLLLAAAATSCKDDPELLTTDVGPEMTIVSVDEAGQFGAKVNFEVSMSDRYALSTLKAQVFFDDDMVAEETIRTKENGSYKGAVTVPLYKDIPDGEATLRFVGQNVRFGVTIVECQLPVSRPRPDHLIFVLDEKEYRMEPTGNDFEYAVTDNFPQKPQGYIMTPALDEAGSIVTFGYDSEQGTIVSDSMDAIPFANSTAGEFAITFNLKSFEASPFIKLEFNGSEMTMVDTDNYAIVTMLTQNEVYTLSGIADLADWDVDMDFFERQDASDPGKLTFLPLSGLYRVTANFKYKYLKVEAMASESATAVLNADGSGEAIWVIGDTNIGKPTTSNSASWSPETGGLCMARVADKKFQITFVAGRSISASGFDFKFFWQKTWDHGEFLGKEDSSFANPYGVITTDSAPFTISDSGNVGLAEGETLEAGGVYRFTVDVTGGTMAAKLTVEKVGQEELPAAELTINGTKLEQIDTDNYRVDLDLQQGQTLTFGGSGMFVPKWINPDFFAITSMTTATLVPVSGRYRITANTAKQIIDAWVLDAEGNQATLSEEGHGALYFAGYGIGSPSLADEPAWNGSGKFCIPEHEPGIYVMTGQAGESGSSVPGVRFKTDGWYGQFYTSPNWGGGFGAMTLAAGSEAYLVVTENGTKLEIPEGVTLEAGATYVLTVDCTAGISSPKVTFEKK